MVQVKEEILEEVENKVTPAMKIEDTEDSVDNMINRIIGMQEEDMETPLVNLFRFQTLLEDEKKTAAEQKRIQQKEMETEVPRVKLQKTKEYSLQKTMQTKPPSQRKPPQKKIVGVTGERLITKEKLVEKLVKKQEKKKERQNEKLNLTKMTLKEMDSMLQKYKRSLELKAKKDQEESRKEIENLQKELDKTMETRNNLIETATIQLMQTKAEREKIEENLRRNRSILTRDREILKLLLESRTLLNKEIHAWIQWNKISILKIPRKMEESWARGYLPSYVDGTLDLNSQTRKMLQEQETVLKLLQEKTRENVRDTATMKRELLQMMCMKT